MRVFLLKWIESAIATFVCMMAATIALAFLFWKSPDPDWWWIVRICILISFGLAIRRWLREDGE